jgi:iron complex outermembrane receptor protein
MLKVFAFRSLARETSCGIGLEKDALRIRSDGYNDHADAVQMKNFDRCRRAKYVAMLVATFLRAAIPRLIGGTFILVPYLAANAQSADVLEEIIVTAKRVETNMQTTPESIHVLSGVEHALAGIDQGRDLSIMVPNFTLNPSPTGESGTTRRIRGLPGVLFYFDGFSVPGADVLQRSFVELDRIEILRGPQGTHFGRNSNGGAVLLVSRKPADDFGAKIAVELGEYEHRTLQFSVDAPISDNLLTKWTGAIFRNDGFLESKTAPVALGAEDSWLARGDILWSPTERLSLRLTLQTEDRESSDPRIVRFSDVQDPNYIAQNVLAGNPDFLEQARAIDPAFPDPPVTLAGDRFTPETHQPGFRGGALGRWETRVPRRGLNTLSRSDLITLTVDWDIGDHWTLRYLGSYSEGTTANMADTDGSEFSIATFGSEAEVSASSHELHAIGNYWNGRLKTLLGAWYSDADIRNRGYSWFFSDFTFLAEGPAPPPPNFAAIDYVRSWGATVGNPDIAGFFPTSFFTRSTLNQLEATESALFAEVTIGILEQLDLTVGYRFTESNEGGFSIHVPAMVHPAEPGSFVDGNPFASSEVLFIDDFPDLGTISTPRISLGYSATDDIYLYASYAEGFTQGRLQSVPGLTEPVTLDPEVVKTTEIGLRSEWLQRRLRFNATWFDSRWEGLPVRVLTDVEDPNNPGSFIPTLVPSSSGLAEASGFEFELSALLGENWEIRYSLGLLDTEYVNIGVPPANGSGIQPGTPFPFAPDVSYSLAVRYYWPLANGAELLFSGDYGWMDEYQRRAESNLQNKNPDGSDNPEPAYGVLNARIVYEPSDGNWSASLYGKNVTDEWYVSGGSDVTAFFGFDNALIGRRRELGVGFTYSFD